MTDDRSVPAGQGEGPRDAEQEHVARLLAAAAAAEPLPPDVASRLDATLADLVAERDRAAGPAAPTPTDGRDAPEEPDRGGSVTPLAPHRRRRWTGLLVAAAGVSVLALGVGNLSGQVGQGGADDAAVTADSAGEALQEAPPSRSAVEDQDERANAASEPEQAPPRLRTVSLASDVRRLLLAAAPADPPTTSPREAAAWCVRPATSRGDELLRVRLDGRRAVLVLRAADAGRRTAEVFGCDDGDTPAATATVAVP